MTADDGCCFDLDFHADGGGRTFVGRQFVRYPLHVGRGLYVDEDDPGVCTVALQSVSGGLFEGERVFGRVRAVGGARARVITSASTVVHAMRGGLAHQGIELCAQAGARLAYLPEALILFPGARLRSDTTVRMAPGALVVACESFLAHDPASGADTFATLDARMQVLDADGALLVRERMLLDGPGWHERRAGVSDRFAVLAGLWILQMGAGPRWLAAVAQALQADGAYAGASLLPNDAGVQVRLLAPDAIAARRAMRAVLACLSEPCETVPDTTVGSATVPYETAPSP